ncbi:cysteine--tRNA ligase [archaeon]|jgi:cysteinyl-tRNA synthetase|nr:cysteine--tRNA ligase [archaeon]MBT4373314.1 cysteine--tRNA ligase [archaeon]MBT4531659.1 cysteine--tRNA ligase [archaeon]MBT7001163.1 cysteine--tRNA ligase [archaeon]MBT7282351.1 cysteine--tRNA ligase [archaeon]
MKLKLYNTLSRKKEEFKPIKKGEVGFYGCGPTVYWYQHIGNLRRYVFEDVLYRTLVYNGFKVKHIINVTDVGHLTSDSDDGEDKVEKAAKKEGKTTEEITSHYFDAFQEDLKKINFIQPTKWTWATKHIKEQIALVKKLEEKGFTYKTSDGVYFDTSQLEDYGRLALLDVAGLKAGKRIDMGEKKNKTDFALWKFSTSGGKRQQEWDSPWGVGFPGWHLECSAMSSKYLGEQFDIHTGGIDNMSPHHINEIAQSETAFGKKPWVKYWLHNNHLNLKEGKMSKSSGKIIRLKDLEEKGYTALEFRYFLLTSHYRKRTAFDFKTMDAAKTAYERLRNKISELKDDKKINGKYLEEFEEAVNDDLNTSRALQVLWKMVRDEKTGGQIGAIKKMEEVLGLDLLKKGKKEKIPKKILDLVKEREKARKDKDWGKADEFREEIKKQGWIVGDLTNGKSGVEKLLFHNELGII